MNGDMLFIIGGKYMGFTFDFLMITLRREIGT